MSTELTDIIHLNVELVLMLYMDDSISIPPQPLQQTEFYSKLEAYFAGNDKAPSLSDWLTLHLSQEQHEMYVLLMQQRMTTMERFPVHFDPLWKSLGYARKDNAKRLLEDYTLDSEYTSLRRSTENSRGAPSEDIRLTLNAAQKTDQLLRRHWRHQWQAYDETRIHR